MKILANRNGCANGGIFNIGPGERHSVRELAEMLRSCTRSTPEPGRRFRHPRSQLEQFYGEGTRTSRRDPFHPAREEILGGSRRSDETALRKTLDAFLAEASLR